MLKDACQIITLSLLKGEKPPIIEKIHFIIGMVRVKFDFVKGFFKGEDRRIRKMQLLSK